MKQQVAWAWDERTKILSYIGMVLAQLGTSGVLSNAKAIAWVGFAASASTAAASHINDWLTKRRQEPETGDTK